MENVEVNVGLKSITKTLNLFVCLQNEQDDSFVFTASVDDLGQIILTPESTTLEFVSCKVVPEDIVPELPDETYIKDSYVIRKTVIQLSCDM